MPDDKRRKTRKKPIRKRKTPAKKSKTKRKLASRRQTNRNRRNRPAKKKLAKAKSQATKKRKKAVAKKKKLPVKRKKAAKSKKVAKKKKLPVKRKKAAKSKKVAKKKKLPTKRKKAAKRKKVAKKKKLPAKRKASKKRGVKLSIHPEPERASKPLTRDELPVTRKQLAPNIYFVKATEFGSFSEDDLPGELVERYRTSTAGMHAMNDNFTALFKKAFYDFMKHKTPFEDPNDIPFFRWGLAVTTKSKKKESEVQSMALRFASVLKDMLPQGASAHIVDEGNYLSVTMNLGNYRKPTYYKEALDYISLNSDLFNNFLITARHIMDEDVYWFEYWDTEELYYD